MSTKITNPLHISIDLKSQNDIIEKKTDGIYQLKNRTGSFKVSIKEYQDELALLKKKHSKNHVKFENEKAILVKKFENVRWIYQLAPNGIPKNAKYTEGTNGKVEWLATVDELEVGGGFIYIQPYLLTDNYVPENNLATGAIYFSYGKPEILDAKWFIDEKGMQPIDSETKVAFGSTVFLRISTKDLYGQIINIEFKDDDSLLGQNEEDKFDDELGIYPFSSQREAYKLKDDIPTNIQKDTHVKRQIKTLYLPTKPENAIVGRLNLEDKNKEDLKVKKIEAYQGVMFPVYIDKFWSKEANDFSEGSEIEIFPAIPERRMKHGESLKSKILKTATLKVSKDGVLLNPNNAQYNMPVLQGEIESDFSNFLPCRYDTIDLFYNKNVPIFNSKTNLDNTYTPIELVAKQKENKVIILLGGLDTLECKDHNTEKDHSKIKFAVSSSVVSPSLGENFLSFNATPPQLSEIGAEDVFGIEPKKYRIVAETCAYRKELLINAFPELGFELSVRIGSGDPAFVRQSKAMTNRKYLHQKDFFGKKISKEIKFKRKQAYEDEKNAKILRFDEYELGFEYTIDGIDEPVESFTLNGDTPVIKAFDTFMWCINSIRELCFDEDYDNAVADAKGANPKNKYFNKFGKKFKKFNKKIPVRIQIDQPKLAGTVKWAYSQSEKQPSKVGTEFTFNIKADPLINIVGSLDLLFVAQFVPYLGAAIKGMTRVADGIGMMDDIANFFLPPDDQITIDVDYKLELFVKGSFEIAYEQYKYHTIDGHKAGEMEFIAKPSFGVVGDFNFELKFGKTETKIEAGAKVEAKWTFSKKSEEAWEVHFDGVYLEVQAKVQTNTTDSEQEPNEPPREFCITPGFTYETQIYNPN